MDGSSKIVKGIIVADELVQKGCKPCKHYRATVAIPTTHNITCGGGGSSSYACVAAEVCVVAGVAAAVLVVMN